MQSRREREEREITKLDCENGFSANFFVIGVLILSFECPHMWKVCGHFHYMVVPQCGFYHTVTPTQPPDVDLSAFYPYCELQCLAHH